MKKQALAVAFISILISCSKSNSGGGNNSMDCSSVAKTFTDVSPIFQSSCATNSSCHGSGSTNGPGPLLTYTQIFSARTLIRAAVASGAMPQSGSLSSSQKNSILCWIDSGAPNN